MAMQPNLDKETVRQMLSDDLGMKNFPAKMVPRQLTQGALCQAVSGPKSITEVEHPPCSPYLSPNDFWLFPKDKVYLKGMKISRY
jgi:hypothetical protein